MKTRHLTTSSTLFAGVLATALCVAPPPIEAEVFGYIGVKGGYSYQQMPKIPVLLGGSQNIGSFKPLTIQAFPVGGNIGFGIAEKGVGLRLEAEYLYRLKGESKRVRETMQTPPAPFDMDLKMQSQSILGNVYLDFYPTPSFSLYVSGGAGVVLLKSKARINMNSSSALEANHNEITPIWQAGVGLSYTFVEHLRLDVNARYVDFRARELNGPLVLQTSLRAIEGLVGLAYRF